MSIDNDSGGEPIEPRDMGSSTEVCASILAESSSEASPESISEELLNQLHELPTPRYHQAELLLVALGHKPASIDLCFVGRGTAKYDSFLAFAEKARISTRSSRKFADDDTVLISYGVTPSDAEKTEIAFWGDDTGGLGLALGYPVTAARSDLRDDAVFLGNDEIDNLGLDQSELAFLEFRMTRAHWREEISHARVARDLVRATDRELYDLVIEEYIKFSS